jgi:murein DD-endopeptidase MepM/ murein hydrolase activator NlpD
MQFPLKKNSIKVNDTPKGFLPNYINETEIPLYPHPGSFGIKRKNHVHEGVDLYCEKNDSVYAIEAGTVINIMPFTGEIALSEWWNNTYCVLIEGSSGAFNYGEISPDPNLKIGDIVEEGQEIGKVLTVLKEDKGRPMNMLHLELYAHGTLSPIKEWALHEEKVSHLLNPTDILLELANIPKMKRMKI